MSGIDIFIAAISALIFFGGLYLNIKSVKLVDQYKKSHAVQPSKIKTAKA